MQTTIRFAARLNLTGKSGYSANASVLPVDGDPLPALNASIRVVGRYPHPGQPSHAYTTAIQASDICKVNRLAAGLTYAGKMAKAVW